MSLCCCACPDPHPHARAAPGPCVITVGEDRLPPSPPPCPGPGPRQGRSRGAPQGRPDAQQPTMLRRHTCGLSACPRPLAVDCGPPGQDEGGVQARTPAQGPQSARVWAWPGASHCASCRPRARRTYGVLADTACSPHRHPRTCSGQHLHHGPTAVPHPRPTRPHARNGIGHPPGPSPSKGSGAAGGARALPGAGGSAQAWRPRCWSGRSCPPTRTARGPWQVQLYLAPAPCPSSPGRPPDLCSRPEGGSLCPPPL